MSGIFKGKHERGAAGKVRVFGMLKRGGHVYALSVADAVRQTVLTALQTRVKASRFGGLYRQFAQLQRSGCVGS